MVTVMWKRNQNGYSIGGAINFLLAILLLISPWFLSLTSIHTESANSWIFGAIIAIASIAVMYGYDRIANWVTLVCGAWVTISPWVLRFHHLSWSGRTLDLVIGIAVAVISVIELWTVQPLPPQKTA